MGVFTHAPIWVGGILVWVLYVGIKSLKDRIIPWPVLLIAPIILLLLKIETFFAGFTLNHLVSITAGLILGGSRALKTSIKIFKESYSIGIPGSYSTLLALSSFFY